LGGSNLCWLNFNRPAPAGLLGAVHMLQRSLLVTSSNNDPVAELKSYYPSFDYLRFALAVVVVVGHCYQDQLWLRTGDLAVRIFFALSGWLIGGILLRATRDDLPRFYFNRATRIWIPYFAAIVLLFGLSAIRETPSPRHASPHGTPVASARSLPMPSGKKDSAPFPDRCDQGGRGRSFTPPPTGEHARNRVPGFSPS
jgi:hypothetical protein